MLLPALSFAQVPHTFYNGDVADAEKINENFQILLERIDELAAGTLNCSTYSGAAGAAISCPDGQTMTGGGFAFADGLESAVSANQPLENGWYCAPGSASQVTDMSCYVRCCGVVNPDLGFGDYCSSNYCVQGPYKVYAQHVWYILTLEEGVYHQFPMDVDNSFQFPPENIGGMSWWLEYGGQEYHVTNLDATCIDNGQYWGECLGEWTNPDILQQAMLSGTIKIKPGPLGVLNEFQIVNDANVVIRFQSSLDAGYVATDAALASTGYSVYRVTPGTGNSGGSDDQLCSELELPFLTTIGGQFNLEYANVNVAVRQTRQIISPGAFIDGSVVGVGAYRMGVCSDTMPGVYNIPYVAIDGLGDKRFLGSVEVKILEEFRPGGEVLAD